MEKKNKVINRNFNRPATVMNIKNNFKKNDEKNQKMQNNIAVISNKEMIDEQKIFKRMLTNKNYRNEDPQLIKSNNYNKTMETLTNSLHAINNKPKIPKKVDISQRNPTYFLKRSATNSFNSNNNYRTPGTIRKEELKTIEDMI